MTQESDQNQCISWTSAEIFPGWATSKFCLSFTDCWRCHANGLSQNALLFLPH